MKKIFKFIMAILGIVYLGVIVFVTGCLLFYNQYKVTQISDKTFIIIDNKSDMYKDGDLVIFTKNPNDEITKGNEIFFYEVTNGTVNVVSGTVTKSEKITDTETTFTINDNHSISSESVIGKTDTASVYPNVGKILYVFESRFGFLLLVILPALIFFFYEIYRLVQDIKAAKETKEDESLESAKNAEPAPTVNTAAEPVVTITEPAPTVANVAESEPAPAAPTAVEPAPTVESTAETVQTSDAASASEVLSQTSEVVSEETKQVAQPSELESLDLNDKKE